MTTTSKQFYAVQCDWPECKARDDGGEYTYWDSPETAIESAYDAEWSVEENPRWRSHWDGLVQLWNREALTFCEEHTDRAYWLSDGPHGDYDTAPSVLLHDARVLVLPDGEMVVLR